MEVCELVRTFGRIRALDGLDLRVPAGSLFALAGPNGSGKSTFIRILSGIIWRSSGRVSVLGLDPVRGRRDLLARIGVLPDFPVLYDVLTPRENFAAISRVRRLPPSETASRIGELSAALEIDGCLDTPVASLSSGEHRKASLMAAMLHAPALLALDEPFQGVDPVSSRAMREMLLDLRRRGVTIIVASHVIPLVESIASHVTVLGRGRAVTSGTLDEVRAGYESLEAAVIDRLGSAAKAPRLDWYSVP